MADYRVATTPGGKEYWIVSNMDAVDEYPALLESRMPIFLDLEPDPTPASWAARMKALDKERKMRETNKKRTVYG